MVNYDSALVNQFKIKSKSFALIMTLNEKNLVNGFDLAILLHKKLQLLLHGKL